jgi:hypothetical protein
MDERNVDFNGEMPFSTDEDQERNEFLSVTAPACIPPPAQKTIAAPTKPTRAETVKGILDRVKNEIKDDDAFLDAWKEVVVDSKVMYKGKQRLMGDVVTHIMSILALPNDLNVLDVRRKEIEIGNLLQDITTQLAFAEAGSKMFGEKKKDLLARGKNQKASRDLIEAQLAGSDDEFRMTRGIWMSAEMNHKFWVTMRTCCTDTLDRLSQIYNTLAAESRIRS